MNGHFVFEAKHAASAFDGEARRFGGRWNSRRTKVVYTSASLALATLETLLNLQDRETLLEYSYVSADVPAKLIFGCRGVPIAPVELEVRRPPLRTFRELAMTGQLTEPPQYCECRHPLFRWNNFLIHPIHPDFDQIKVGKAVRFPFDNRLMKP